MVTDFKLKINISRSWRKSMLICLVMPCLLSNMLPAKAKENNAGQIVVYGIGNGAMASRSLESAFRGWMQLLPMFFPINIHFEDYSRQGISVRDFVQQGRWDEVKDKIRENDYVLVSFNENNQSQLLHNILDDIESKKARSVIISTGTATSASQSKIKLKRSIKNKGIGQGYEPVYLSYDHDLRSSKSTGNTQTADMKRPPIDSGLLLNDAIRFTKRLAADLKNIIHLNKGNEPAQYSKAVKNKEKSSEWTDLIARDLQLEAAIDFRKNQLPETSGRWTKYAPELRAKLMHLCGAKTFHQLDLDVHETGRIQRNRFSVRKIYFQTRPGIYATANLYVPEGKGPFPAVINMHGHWPDGKAGEMVASCAISLALNGYVCLNMDAWGAGERTTVQNKPEYHGSNLGAALMDIGETLLGNQVTDNMRGVDLLSSLPFVDTTNLGATGASGGGNQTMWLAAIDTRIMACMPVVSVGTFQSYIMGSNCVCELMPSGLTCTEEAGVLGLIAPRAVKICSALQDGNPAFIPAQMLRTFHHAEPVFHYLHHPDHIRYQLFNTPHGYHPEMRSAMLGWFDEQLKGQGNGDFKSEKPFEWIPPEKLAVFQGRVRDTLITTTISHVRKAGAAFKANLLSNRHLNPIKKRDSLKTLLMLPTSSDQEDTSFSRGEMTDDQGRVWQKGALITKGRHMITYRYLPATRPGGRILLVCPPDSASAEGSDRFPMKFISDNFGDKIASCRAAGEGILIADLWGLGENGSALGRKVNGRLPLFHTVARAELWLGHTVMGEWVSDLHVLADFIHRKFRPAGLGLAAGKEVAVAALAVNAFFHHFDQLYLSHPPISYVIDKRAGMDYFNMAIHIPHILNWGDIGLMAALNSHTKIELMRPVTLTGSILDAEQRAHYLKEFEHFNTECKGHNRIIFN